MKRSRFARRSGLSRDAENLSRLAVGMAESGSRAEDRFWETQLTATIDRLLEDKDETAFNDTLDHLLSSNPRAYDELADYIESRAETALRGNLQHDILLLAAPVLSWSRFRIPSSSIAPAVVANLRVHLQAHVLADDALLAVADFLFSPDQLPAGYCATAQFADALGQAALDRLDLHIDPAALAETGQFLSDTRYLLAAVAVPKGQALFRWQHPGCSRDQALEQWRAQGGACIAPMLPGCALEVVLPETYFAASREADRESRPYSVRASVSFLGTTLETPASSLRAVVAPFYDQQLEEYRIGFAQREKDTVVHGVVWPLLGAEDENADIVGQIETVLRDSGVRDIIILDHRYPLEYCDDCGAPYYPSPEGEVVHAEMPEEQAEQAPRHLH
ncbi:DUF2863 family protein [Cognatazoarcus halotolerans]|uniref:DUF2863 family protein n=1 Tax=Cognatazoarcus halotolerans TaxID=2686016 RepID=UPI001356C33D|nr:DUF2863 family protein [Cognatazoarcus halotolerans]MBX3679321.1 DUF2863 family protein [Rhodocyclaceae bacterium]MCB1898396.1 DUF2863 family protein [Rhodocyclaceae bacterium]MCP5311484.1 DUF2863 family protein [Zoogloeaceae bacterium]